METSKPLLRLVTVVRAFLFASKGARETPFRSQLGLVVSRVWYLFASGESRQSQNAKVDAYGGLQLRQLLDRCVFAENRDMPAVRGVQAYGNTRRLRALWKRPAPADIERVRHLRELQLPVSETEGASREHRRTTRALALEARVSSPLLEEVRVRGLQVPKRLLQRDARYVVQKQQVGLFLPASQRSVLRRVTNRLLGLRPSHRPLGKRLVVDETRAPDRTTQQQLLLLSRIETVLEPAEHVYSIWRNYVTAIGNLKRSFLPCLQSRGSGFRCTRSVGVFR